MQKSVILLLALLLSILAAMAAKGLLEQPPPLRMSSSPDQFDAMRAKARLAIVLGDQRPHPADSQASDLVRARLVAELRKLGLNPIVRDQFACNELYKRRGVSCARVRNVIAILGAPTGRAILLNAHYDSVPVGPGASDDGIGIATLLEVGAILKNRPLNRPLILLFNEGEEQGLIGARAFLSDPLSRNVGALVNLEARGVRGPVNMFETSRPNSTPIAIFAAVKDPVANSLSTDVYRLLSNYTDVNSFSERNWLTLNLAPIGNETRYHSAGDDLAALDPATLQHMGDQTLALSENLACRDWRPLANDRIFMDVSGRWLISLPLTTGAVLLLGLLIAMGWIAFHRHGLAGSASAIVASAGLATILSWLMLEMIGAIRHGTFWRAHQIWTLLAVYATTVLAGVLVMNLIARDLEKERLRPAFWFVFLIFGGAVGLAAPGGIVFFIFPPLIALAGMALAQWSKPAETVCSTAAILVLFLTFGAMLGLLEELLNGGPMWVFALLGSLLLIPALIEARPLIDAANPQRAAILAGLLCVTGWVVVLAVPAYSADRQERFVIQHFTNTSQGTSWWSVLNDGRPMPAGFGGHWKRGILPFSDQARWLAPAPGNRAAAAPGLEVLSREISGNERVLTVRLIANGNDEIELIAPPDARIRSAGAKGFVRPIDPNEGGKYFISCFGRACDGATIAFTIGKHGSVEFQVLGGKLALPQSATPLLLNRPRFARPQYSSDETFSLAQVNL